jgi:GT2 family glycosyltransferase
MTLSDNDTNGRPDADAAVCPPIEPVPAGVHRPLWSVMIPTYNCAEYLRSTLASVLQQDPGPEQMQVEIVDDCSTRDDPEAVARQLGGPRVVFYRQPKNVGASNNFNTCIRRARGRLVHILHGDDFVTPEFYAEVAGLAERFPQAALLATRAHVVDADGKVRFRSERVPAMEDCTTDASSFYYMDPLRTPAVVVRREFYERHGGFRPDLVHTADWEMWARAVALGGGVVLDRPLAGYRDFGMNDTSRLRRTGEGFRDYLRLADVLAARHTDFDLVRFQCMVRLAAIIQRMTFQGSGDAEAAAANQAIVDELRDLSVPMRWWLKERVASLPVLGPVVVKLVKRWIHSRY